MIVVILSFNHPEITNRCVQSVSRFISTENIVLVHNGSEIQHQSLLTKQFPNLDHLIIPQNKGFSGGANAGLRHAFSKSSDWTLFITNDCSLIELGPPPRQPGLFAPLIWRRKKGFIDSIGGCFDPKKGKLKHFRSETEFLASNSHCYVPGTAFWLDRKSFEMAQGFDESLGTYWEDVDFSMRLKKLNLNLGVHTSTQLIHSVGKTCHSKSHYTTYLFQRNRKRVSWKYSRTLFERIELSYHLVSGYLTIAWRLITTKKWKQLRELYLAIKD